ncbi:hypothetical protein [Vineibacter terrae]|uniref:hypothetical protein n=1 Tax=Vineibacter terrae TaxID=2586908 RepID=UPI002E37319E|nr:hypothetical protein [Vineibacter terrae]HEX2888347.1 hypothetical protein [Vineibacter terrae]
MRATRGRSRQELLDFCRANLSSVKLPRTLEFERELPRDANGKLYKKPLRDRYWSGRQSRIVEKHFSTWSNRSCRPERSEGPCGGSFRQ